MMRNFQGGRIIRKDGKKTSQEREAFNESRHKRTGHDGNGHRDIFNGRGGVGHIKPKDDTRSSLLEQISDAESGRLINPDRTPGSSFYIYKDPKSAEVMEHIALLRARLDAHIAGQPEPGSPHPNSSPAQDR